VSRALYVDPERLRAGRVALDKDDAHYLRRVLRLSPGATLTLFDGAGHRAAAALVELRSDGALLEAEEVETCSRPRPAIHLALSIVKGERMDWAVQKLAELGVATIAPMSTERTVVELAQHKAEKRRQRYESVARAAARQSENLFVPTILSPGSFEAALGAMPEGACRVICAARAQRSMESVVGGTGCDDVAIAIGPEGGFADSEVARAEELGFAAVHLGPGVLRVETAAIAASVLGTHLAFYNPGND